MDVWFHLLRRDSNTITISSSEWDAIYSRTFFKAIPIWFSTVFMEISFTCAISL